MCWNYYKEEIRRVLDELDGAAMCNRMMVKFTDRINARRASRVGEAIIYPILFFTFKPKTSSEERMVCFFSF